MKQVKLSIFFFNYVFKLINNSNNVLSNFLEADKLCGRLYQKLNSVLSHKIVLEHMPLLIVCLEGLGKLAQKFPNIAGTSISYLRDFLIDPSPILTKLHSQAQAQQKREIETSPTFIISKKYQFLCVFKSEKPYLPKS